MSVLSLLPVIINIQIVQNTDNQIEFALTESGVAVDISNDTITLVMKTNYGGTIKINKTNGPGGHSDPTLGKTRFLLSKTEMQGASIANPETWVYQLRRFVAGSGDEIVYMAGDVHLTPSF
jgi:hypothetical protein